MGKHVNTRWKVVVGTTDLSKYAFDVQIADAKEKVDVSGFSATGSREFLPGLQDQTVTVQMLQDRSSGGPYYVIQPLYDSGTTFAFFVQEDSTAGTSAANPVYGGTASVYSAPASAALNAREEVTYEFSPAPNSVFSWGTTAP